MNATDATLAPTLVGLGPRPRVALDRLAVEGFRGVQLSASQPGLRPRELDRSGRRDLAGCLRRLELSPAGLDLWIPRASLFDPARVDRAVADLLDAVGLAGDLGRCPLSVVLPESTDDPTVAAVVQALIDRALRHGVTLADHAVPPTMRDDIGVGVDPATWLSHDRDPAVGVAEHARRLVVVRWCDLTADGQRAAPAGDHDGRLDRPGYRMAIAACGYRRHVVIDTRGWPDPWAGLHVARQSWAAAGAVAARGRPAGGSLRSTPGS